MSKRSLRTKSGTITLINEDSSVKTKATPAAATSPDAIGVLQELERALHRRNKERPPILPVPSFDAQRDLTIFRRNLLVRRRSRAERRKQLAFFETTSSFAVLAVREDGLPRPLVVSLLAGGRGIQLRYNPLVKITAEQLISKFESAFENLLQPAEKYGTWKMQEVIFVREFNAELPIGFSSTGEEKILLDLISAEDEKVKESENAPIDLEELKKQVQEFEDGVEEAMAEEEEVEEEDPSKEVVTAQSKLSWTPTINADGSFSWSQVEGGSNVGHLLGEHDKIPFTVIALEHIPVFKRTWTEYFFQCLGIEEV
jgi:hypothetical protein